MKLARGARLGPYEIVAPLGAGGMGEVYRARDTRLGRDVAIKVLPDALSGHPEIRARFEREARTISALNHPNICTLFDVGHEDGAEYLVMELVDGEPLSDRLHRGALPAPELLRIGIQIADALERAHRAGVIHRDLKPGNVMVTRAGAKLMDFGLSRATGMAGATGSTSSPGGLTQSPTIAQPLTAEGTLLGTFQYMAPEQLEGREADARSDVWALGCVLYEMATGRRAFEGRSQASLIAAILEREPAAIEGSAGDAGPRMEAPPAGLEWLIRHCLAKDPDDRIQTAHDVKLQLQRIAEAAGITAGAPRSGISSASAAPAIGARARAGARTGWLAAAAMLVALAAFVAWAWPRLFPAPAAFRFHPNTHIAGAADVHWPRVSPDGRALVFQAADSTGLVRAWLLRLDEAVPQPIRGSEGLQRAYWSPDGREIAFVASGRIERLPVAGGTPVTVCPAPRGADLSWGARGQILLDGLQTDSLRVVPAGGGELRPATRVSRADHEIGSAWPCFLPDGQHFLFIGIRNDGLAADIRLGRLGSLDSKLIGRSEGRAEYAPGGWVLFVRGGALVAQRLQVGAGRLTGDPITLVDNIDVNTESGDFSVSRNGVFAFEPLGAAGFGVRVLDRHGAPAGPVLAQGELGNPCLSPDGHRLLYERRGPLSAAWGDVSIYDLERGADSQVTFTGGQAVRSTWSPDGRRFAYTRISPDGRVTLMVAPAEGLGAVDSIPVPGAGMYLTQWIGNRLVGYSSAPRPLYVDLQDARRRVLPLLGADDVMGKPQVSPDGRWVVGSAPDGTTIQSFVRNLSGPAGRWRITFGQGGFNPFWTRNGAEIVFESTDGRVMAVDVRTRDGFQAGAPHALFKLPVQSLTREVASWAPDPRGERFAVLTRSSGGSSGDDIEIVTDIRALLSRR